MDKAALKAQLVSIIIDGENGNEALADAMILAATTPIDPDPVVDPNVVAPTAEGSRDETHDSIDPATGTLTDDAVAKRAADKAADDVAEAELEVAAAEEAADEGALATAKDKLTAAQKRKADTAAALAADDAPAGTVDETPTDDGPGAEGVVAGEDPEAASAVGGANVTTAGGEDSVTGSAGDDAVTTSADLQG